MQDHDPDYGLENLYVASAAFCLQSSGHKARASGHLVLIHADIVTLVLINAAVVLVLLAGAARLPALLVAGTLLLGPALIVALLPIIDDLAVVGSGGAAA